MRNGMQGILVEYVEKTWRISHFSSMLKIVEFGSVCFDDQSSQSLGEPLLPMREKMLSRSLIN